LEYSECGISTRDSNQRETMCAGEHSKLHGIAIST